VRNARLAHAAVGVEGQRRDRNNRIGISIMGENNKTNEQQQAAASTAGSAESESKTLAATESAPAGGAETEALKGKVVEAVKTCYDPEIPVDIYELGLIYDISVTPSSEVAVKMTLTSPACPAAASLPGEVEDKIRVMAEVKDVKVEVVWDPPWNPSMMSEAARLQLGMM
jgi:FeS assembly SUF system protein